MAHRREEKNKNPEKSITGKFASRSTLVCSSRKKNSRSARDNNLDTIRVALDAGWWLGVILITSFQQNKKLCKKVSDLQMFIAKTDGFM